MKEQDNINYTLEGFKDFIDDIEEMSSDYDYVVVRSRRCFNIIARWLPNVDFIAFPALMSQYDKLADYYQKNKRFPKILLIDDLVFNGREMAHDLEQLEDILVEELLDRNILSRADNYRYSVHSRLADSITTYVYAKSAGPLFIDNGYEYGYLAQLYFKRETYYDELRDYSLQLGEKLKKWDIANTDYTYSVRSQMMSDVILQQPNGRIGETNWVRQEGTCLGERMILYTRLNGSGTTNRIDTIRFFPNRISHFKELPFISSFSFFGTLSQNASIQLIREVRQELENAGLNKLAEILKESSNQKINFILLENQMNLISCILSVAICFDFFSDVLSEEQQKQTMIAGNFWKISRNFGKETELIEEFEAISKKDLRTRLGTIILNITDSNASELIPFNPNNLFNNDINMESINLEKITDTMRNVLFRVEMESQKSAYRQYAHPWRFDSNNYQTEISTDNPYNRDGIIGIKSLFDLEEIKQFLTSSSDIYSLIFAIIGLIDNYQASLKLKSFEIQNGNRIFQNCIITHEQAGFYFAEKFAPLIKALVINERETYGIDYFKPKEFRELIMSCFDTEAEIRIGSELVKISNDVRQQITKELTHLLGEENLNHALEKNFDDLERFYDAGFEFCGFNFDNLRAIARNRSSTLGNNSQLEKCFCALIKKAQEQYDAAIESLFSKSTKPSDLEDPQEEGPRLSLTNNQ